MLAQESGIHSKGAPHHHSQRTASRHGTEVAKQPVGSKAGAVGVPIYCHKLHAHSCRAGWLASQTATLQQLIAPV